MVEFRSKAWMLLLPVQQTCSLQVAGRTGMLHVQRCSRAAAFWPCVLASTAQWRDTSKPPSAQPGIVLAPTLSPARRLAARPRRPATQGWRSGLQRRG